MLRYRLISLLICSALGSFSWGQAGGSGTELATGKLATVTASGQTAASNRSGQAKSSTVAPDDPVITINGLCDDSPAGVTKTTSCKTVITQSQFEKVINAIQPDMPARARREFALRYANALTMAQRAETLGLDQGQNYEEQMKLARIQILTKELNKAIQAKASQISHQEIEDYYNNNRARFENVEMDRLYVPKTRQQPATSDKVLSGGRQDRSPDPEQRMREEADILHERAVAGEEFTKLQAESYQVGGIKSTTLNTSISIRRTSLPANQMSVMDLKPGEVSPVLTDANGYIIFKVKTKTVMALDHAQEEIKATLRTQRLHEEISDIEDSATPVLDDVYFVSKGPQQRMTRASEQGKTTSTPYSGKPEE
jgi:hypothetical protein